MEDIGAMSSSASTVRTLHHELTFLKEQANMGPPMERPQLAEPTVSSTATTPNLLPTASTSTSTTAESITSTLILPSPPDSPNLSPVHSSMHSPSVDSVSESSLPSVSSSFFFSSSAAGSPGRSRNSSYPGSYPHSEHEQDRYRPPSQLPSTGSSPLGRHNLIIPSLTLPSALRRPTPFGQTLGTLRLLVLGAQGAGKSFLTGLLLEDNEDVVEVGTWEDWEAGLLADRGVSDAVDGSFSYGKVLRASTDWTERRDAFGAERYEPTGNVHIVELPGYSQDADATELISRLKSIIEGPFRTLYDILHPDMAPSATVASLLASPTSPLYTAMVFLLPSAPTLLDIQIISALSTHIPLIVLPRLHGPHRDAGLNDGTEAFVPPPKLSAFRPPSAVVLRNGLFHSPETVALLRNEAADRFLKWREVERSVEGILFAINADNERGGLPRMLKKRRFGERDWKRQVNEEKDMIRGRTATEETHAVDEEGWSKAKWEAEWLESLSKDVDEVRRRRREMTITEKDFLPRPQVPDTTTGSPPSDPDSDEKEERGDGDGSNDQQVPPGIQPSYAAGAIFDPLHLPSLVAFSFSLLCPLKARLSKSMRDIWIAFCETRLKLALLGGFCLGVGVGAGLFS